MRRNLILGTLLAAAAALAGLGCTSSAASQAASLNPTTGAHPTTWVQDHWTTYLKDPAGCTSCHGSNTDPANAGGTSQVSCFSCHEHPAPNGPHHASAWGQAPKHGRSGAQAHPNGTFGFAGTGFASCTPCHGSNYNDPVGPTPSCTSCHTKAPHPDAPWTNATDISQPTHDQTDPGNAPECAKCHTLGANSSRTPNPPAPAGTAPGCFNGTLCHTTNING